MVRRRRWRVLSQAPNPERGRPSRSDRGVSLTLEPPAEDVSSRVRRLAVYGFGFASLSPVADLLGRKASRSRDNSVSTSMSSGATMPDLTEGGMSLAFFSDSDCAAVAALTSAGAGGTVEVRWSGPFKLPVGALPPVAGRAAGGGAGLSILPRMIGRPSLPLPMTTILEFGDCASASVASMPRQRR